MHDSKLPVDKRATEIQEKYKKWSNARRSWEQQAREDIDFYLGNHWTQDEVDELASRNQSSLSMDRLYSAIEQFKAIVTSKKPKYRVYAREDSDHKMSTVINTMLEYIWDISDGDEAFKQVVHDYSICGLGYFQAYLDTEADYGRGDIKIGYVDPFRVYVDPNSRHRYFDDAEGIIVTTVLSKSQLTDQYDQLLEVPEGMDKPLIEYINSGTGLKDEDYPSSNNNTDGTYTPAEVKDKSFDVDKYRIINYYDKIKVPYFRVVDTKNGSERIVSFEEMQQMNQLPDFQEAVAFGDIQIAEVKQTRVRCTTTVGQVVLFQMMLNTDRYPIVPCPNIWTNTPYPMSDVRKGRDMQRYINKMVSLLTSHAQASAGLKLLIPQGSITDMEQLERDWANPTATIEYDASFGEPHFPSPQPLASTIMQLPQMLEKYIDLNMGIYEMQQGNPDAAPRTASATMQLEDFGARRSKSKLRDIEGSLRRLGTVVYNLCKKHYDYKKTFRIVQPNNDVSEATINEQFKLYDDKGQAIQQMKNDMNVGQYDIKIVGNSTMPSNKWAEFQIYMEAFQMGLIDKTEALKKTEVFDKEGILKRFGEISQMQSAIANYEQQIKELKGDLQTARRESVSARQRTEVEKFKSRLNERESDMKADTKVAISKFKDKVTLEGKKLEMQNQQQQMPQTNMEEDVVEDEASNVTETDEEIL